MSSTILNKKNSVAIDTNVGEKNLETADRNVRKKPKTTSVEIRDGAQIFRDNVLRIYNFCCCVTGSKISAILEAAHIQDHSDSRNNDFRNGLCLRSDIHTLFDRDLLKIDTSYSIQLDESIKNSEYGNLAGRKINLPDQQIDWPSKSHIQWKFEKNNTPPQ